MDEKNWRTIQFEDHRDHLRGVAYRMLGSLNEADDAVQEAWLRLDRSDTSGVENLGGWLTTVVSRVALDMLRSRKSRREEPLGAHPISSRSGGKAPEQELILAEAVGLALLVVMEKLAPAERVAFVLHDMFDLPFEEIAPIVGRTPAAARQLASRARRRVRGTEVADDSDHTGRRDVIDAFLSAAQGGDFEALLAVLDPDVVLRSDPDVLPAGAPTEIRGVAEVAKRAAKGRARAARLALLDGDVGVVVAPRGRLLMVIRFTIAGGKIVEMDAVADPERLRQIDLTVLSD